MRWMNRMVRTSILLLIMLVLAGCGASEEESDGCMAAIDWVDFLMVNNITYNYNYDGASTVANNQIGNQISEVSYMLDNHACTGHVSENGDAAYLPVGTAIYELQGYKSDFRVVANSKIYEARDNPNAEKIRDLLDIEGKVERVSLESGIDGSPIGDFSVEASSEFIREVLPLANVGFDAIYEKIKHETGVFLRIHLEDGTSLRVVYYPKANALSLGAFGAPRLNELVMSQRTQIKAAAGM